MASSIAKLVCAVLIMGLTLPGTLATEYEVCDSDGWALGVNVLAWISTKTVHVGDVFNFHFVSPRTVALVDADGFLTCDASHAIYNDASGYVRHTFTQTGTYYFISAGLLDCAAGLKLKVVVV
ncbi:Cupredoxin superfamily protein [Striga hermonthica]|uniref:Cupredoxin superfamily protein n=1 Tax=Striga hermonthica TaxID=68872 RepID=A0A9N7P4J1_STRHE|nr:Cupredoxin superfamily protein [Striga hermonthica]